MTQRPMTAASDKAVLNSRALLDFLGLFGRGAAAGIVTCVVLAAIVLLFSGAAAAAPDDAIQLKDAGTGSLLIKAEQPGFYRCLPLLKTDVEMRVSGIVSRTRVTQQFRNPTAGWLEGIYVFPLPENAAVDHLKMRIGERAIEGRIKEREAARQTYEQAKKEGRKTSLIEQERANIFTNSVANIGPGESVTIEIEYQQTLHYDQGAFRLRFPMVVGPRYIPGHGVVAGAAGTGWAPNTDIVPDAARITPPVIKPGDGPVNPVSLRVELNSGFPLAKLASAHHRVNVAPGPGGAQVITLSEGTVPADRDFELVWAPAGGRAPQAAVFTENRAGKTYALLMVVPPEQLDSAAIRIAREVIFVIDTSGSMAGLSIEQAREALLLALDRLAAGDRFNVIEFNSTVSVLFDEARAADEHSLRRARAFVRGLKARGGTEMAAALHAALNNSDDARMLRQVVFLTDGAVGNEDQLFRIIHDKLGDSRLFTIGIGSAPNSFFMTKAAQFGHGTFTYIGNLGEVKQKMTELFAKLESPVLSDIRIRWPNGAAVEMWPQRVPDLYLGEPVLVSAAFEGPAGEVVVSGRRGGTSWEAVVPAAAAGAQGGVGALWARYKIAALMDQLRSGASQEEVRGAVTAVALEHHLVSRYTSLVAVDVTPTRADGAPLNTAAIPTNLPHGWQYESVFGELPQTATTGPLHAVYGLAALLLSVLLWLVARRGAGLRAAKLHFLRGGR